MRRSTCPSNPVLKVKGHGWNVHRDPNREYLELGVTMMSQF